eukprot:2583073-Prymnesium_polylepis.1
MNDRANAEKAAARMLTGSNAVNPTCGEHGAIVTPMAAATKAMDQVVRGWMGKTDSDSALDEHKVRATPSLRDASPFRLPLIPFVPEPHRLTHALSPHVRALHMAVGWNKSPAGALIYCTSKYVACFSDKGYAVGQEYRGFNEYTASLNADDLESILLLGHSEDLLSIKGSRCYVAALNAPVVDRILQDGPGSFYRFSKEQEQLARPGGGWIRGQIIAGAESEETRACVRAVAIIGDFYMWPMLRAVKHKNADGSDPHILDMAPIYQAAYETLLKVKDTPRLVATGQCKLLPSYLQFYATTVAGEATKARRIKTDMERIYKECENCPRIEELLKAGLNALAEKFHSHTTELQKGGRLTGANDTPELRKKLSGVNRTNTVVESVFALEKFLSLERRAPT